MSYKNVVNTTQQENTRSNKNVKFFWRKPFSVETPSLGEKSFLGRSHFWGEALFGEKPFSGMSHFRGEAIFGGEAILGRSHFLGRSHSGEKPFTGEKPFSGRSHFWGEAIKKFPCPLDPPSKPTVQCSVFKDMASLLNESIADS